MPTHSKPYTRAEDAILLAGQKAGKSAPMLADLLPDRTVNSISTRMSNLRSAAAGISDAERLAKSAARQGSAALYERTLALFQRTAKARGITLHEAARAHLAHRPTTKGA